MNEKNIKVVVFGGSGFIGSYAADYLSEAGYNVYIYDIKESPYLRQDQQIIIGDILDEKKVDEITKDAYAVYHFAALSDLDEGLNKPVKTVEINVLGTIRILEACKKNNVKRFVFASSVYVNSKEGGFYRCSKKAAEEYIHEYHNQYDLDYCILRYGSLYGPRCSADNGLWQILNNAINSNKLEYMGHPETLREYIHVFDAAKASVLAMENDFNNQHIVITGQDPMKVLDLLKMVGEILDIKKDIIFKDTSYPGHYLRTPYSYNEKIGMKYTPSMHVDFGQGLLQMISEIKNSNITN